MVDLRKFIGEKHLYIKYNYVNYYHALIDTLPILLQIRKYSPGIVFFLPCQPFKVVSDIAHNLNIKNLNLECLDEVGEIYESKCINPLHMRDTVTLINSLPELRANLTIQENSPKKIIIKRDRGSKGKQRNICKGVFDYIASLGFTEIICKNYTVSEQANLFYNAEVIVSPHGADLANMIFCQSDCNVIELSNGYNPGLFNSHVNNALRNKKIFLQKKIIFNENIMQNNILFQKTHLSDRYSKLCGTRLFEIGKNFYVQLKLPIVTKDKILDDFQYSVDSFKEIFNYAL